MFLGGLIWIGSHELDPAQADLRHRRAPLEIQVVSLDWKWLFIYPEQGIASVNQLVVPARTPLHFSLTSASVMNVFFVPQLGSMIYTMNGMVTQLNLQADKPGTFRACRRSSAAMASPTCISTSDAVPADAIQRMGAERTAHGGPALDAGSYAELGKQSHQRRARRPIGRSSRGSFTSIATQKIAPAPGPQAGRPTARLLHGREALKCSASSAGRRSRSISRSR